jgi:tRNA-2-methylthio-N6-dimethylallyladenosine synthase
MTGGAHASERAKDLAKRVFIKTYGCQMNVYDSARMFELLAPLGFLPVEEPDKADLVIFNTCHIREKAVEKLFSELGAIHRTKLMNARRNGGEMIVAVGGCVAQAEGAEILRRAPFVDLVFGPQNYHQLPDLVARALRDRGDPIVATDFPAEPKFDHLPEAAAARGVTAFLTIQEGCDKFCSFCVVPYTRGAEYSRPVVQIVTEAYHAARSGVREITLLGQNVNAYHGEGPDGRDWGLGDLVRRLAELPGLDRIRYTTSHPRDVDDGLIGAHRDVPQLMPFVHLPVQSGANRILSAMNRHYTVDSYRQVVERLRSARSDLALSSDFIVGFPGESDEDFVATIDLVDDIGFAQAFSFKYSPRPGTPAASLSGQIPESVKSDRLAMLQAALESQKLRFNNACVGRTLPVLLEKPGRHPGQLVGRSPYLQSIYLTATERRIGEIVLVQILGATANSLTGSIEESTAG